MHLSHWIQKGYQEGRIMTLSVPYADEINGAPRQTELNELFSNAKYYTDLKKKN